MNVYDFDGTIYNGDSSIDFYLYCLKHNKKIILDLPAQIYGIFQYKIGKISKTEMKAKYFSFLKRVKDIDQTVEKFWDLNSGKIYDWYIKQQDTEDLVISASPEFLLRSICNRIGIQWLIASEVDKYTGIFYSENCHDTMKVVYFREKYPNAIIECFYSDSTSDEPMARIARKAYLIKKGQIRPWQIGE